MVALKYIEEWDITITMVHHWALEKRKFDYQQGKDYSNISNFLAELFSPLELQVLKTFETPREPSKEELEILRDLASVKSIDWYQIIQLALKKRLTFPTTWLESFLLEIFSE